MSVQLLIERAQRDSHIGLVGRPIFQLWAKFELTEEEQELIDKYKVEDAVLYLGNTARDWIRAIKWGVPFGFVFGIVVYLYVPRLSLFLGPFLDCCPNRFFLRYLSKHPGNDNNQKYCEWALFCL